MCMRDTLRAMGRNAWMRWMVLWLGAVLGGCGTPGERIEQGGADLPADFALSVTVFSEFDDPELIARLERWRRPARFVMEADRRLRAAQGPAVTPEVYPPIIRQLRREQVRDLWRLVRAGELLRADHPGRVPDEAVASIPPLGTTALIAVTHDGRVQTRRIVMDAGDGDALAASALVDRLAELCWIRE